MPKKWMVRPLGQIILEQWPLWAHPARCRHRFECCHHSHVRGSARVYGSRKTQHSSQVAHRHRAHTRIHGSNRRRRSAHPEVRPSLPNDGDKDSPIDLAWDIRIHEPAKHASADGCTTCKDASSHVPMGCRWKHCVQYI